MSTIIHGETQEKYSEPKVYPKQRIEVPVRYVEENIKIIRGSGIRTIPSRTVTALGTVEVERYGRRRVEYGTCICNGWTIVVVRDGNSWKAIDRKEKQK